MFIVIGKSAARRGILIIGLLTAAAVFYVLSQARGPAAPSSGTLVFSSQFMPGLDDEEATASTGEGGAPAEPAGGGSAGGGKEGDLAAVAALAPGQVGSALDGANLLAGVEGVQPGEQAAAVAERIAVFDMYRLTRDQNRSRWIELVQGMLESDRLSDAERRGLQEQLLRLMRLAELEENAEGLLIARGLTDVIVMLGERGAEVVVADRLEREDAARVGDVVARIAGVPLDAITIVDGAAN